MGGVRVHLGEALPPTRVAQRPAELALGLGVGGAAGVGSNHHCAFAGEQACEPDGEVARRFGSECVREHGQPLAYRGGLVVDDVVERGAVVFEREHGRCGGVVEVDERGDAAAVADDRELALAHGLDQAVVGGAVEAAVAKGDSAGVGDRWSRWRIAAVVSRVAGRRVGSSGSSRS